MQTTFAERLNAALDRAGIQRRGRQRIVGEMFEVSQKGARNWLIGTAIPRTKRISTEVTPATRIRHAARDGRAIRRAAAHAGFPLETQLGLGRLAASLARERPDTAYTRIVDVVDACVLSTRSAA